MLNVDSINITNIKIRMRSASQSRTLIHKKLKPFIRLKQLLKSRHTSISRYNDLANKELQIQFPYIKNTKLLVLDAV